MNLSPAVLGFARALGLVVVFSVLSFIGNAANLNGVVNEGLATLIAAGALALEHAIEAKTGKAAFGAVQKRV